MGTLRHIETRERITLASPTVIGRATGSDLVIRQPRVSAQHATLFYDGGWYIRDLGSRNGTFIGERRLPVGIRAALSLGTEVRFAEEIWTLEYDGPPQPRLFDPTTGERTDSSGDAALLVLPSSADPQLTIYRQNDQGWIAEFATKTQRLTDGDAIELGGRQWLAELPLSLDTSRLATTIGDDRMPDSLRAMQQLVLTVSQDEESVVTTLRFPHTTVQLKPRSFHYLMLILARARLADHADGASSAESGWRYSDQIANLLAIDVARLNVEVYRMRKQLTQLGLRDAACIVERRPQAGQMRHG